MPNNNSSLYVFSTTPNVSSNNFTTLYSNAAAIPVQGAYGNSNVEAFLNQGTDGGNTVENILANGNIIANGSVTVGGNLSVVGETDLGSVTNVHIAGGTLNYVLATDGTGNLSWAPQVDNAGNTIPYISFVAQSNSNNQQFANSLIAKYDSNVAMNVFRNGINIKPTQFTLPNPTTLQINQFLNTGDTIDILSTNSGSNITVGGNVTEIQYNGGNILAADPAFTYNPGGQLLTVGNLLVNNNFTFGNILLNNANIGNLTSNIANITTADISNLISSQGNIGNLTSNIANITTANISNLIAPTANITTGNITNFTSSNVSFTGNANLGSVGNVHILGGTSGYVLQTDGTGNLSWTAQTGGGGGNGVPGGANTQVQFNNAGNFGASANFTFNSTTNILTATNIAGDGSRLSNLAGANVIGTVANANYSAFSGLASNSNVAFSVNGANVTGTVANANYSAFSGLASNSNVAFYVSGSNVVGTVANANFASFANSANFVTSTVANATHANVADLANSVAGANVVGTVANANYSSYSNIANVANSVNVANVVGLGNIATINITGSTSNVLYGNGTFAPILGNINANYANYAGNAFSVTGSNVVGSVSSANTASTVTTNAQPNITSVGTLTSLSVSGNSNIGGNLSVTGNVVINSNVSANYSNANVFVGNQSIINDTGLLKFNESVQSIANTGTSISPNVTNTSIFLYTANSNFTFNGLTNAVAGTSATVVIQQDSTGGRTMSSTMKFAGGSKTLSTGSGATDIICLFYNGTTYYASLTKGYV